MDLTFAQSSTMMMRDNPITSDTASSDISSSSFVVEMPPAQNETLSPVSSFDESRSPSLKEGEILESIVSEYLWFYHSSNNSTRSNTSHGEEQLLLQEELGQEERRRRSRRRSRSTIFRNSLEGLSLLPPPLTPHAIFFDERSCPDAMSVSHSSSGEWNASEDDGASSSGITITTPTRLTRDEMSYASLDEIPPVIGRTAHNRRRRPLEQVFVSPLSSPTRPSNNTAREREEAQLQEEHEEAAEPVSLHRMALARTAYNVIQELHSILR